MLNLIIVSALIFVVAVVMTMVGKGGGNFYVVILTMAGIPMHEAATTGQFVLFSASVAAILIFQKNRSISWTLAVVIGTFSSLSALGGGYFSHIFNSFSLKLIFAVMLFLAGIVMLVPVPENLYRTHNKSFGVVDITSGNEQYSVNLLIALPIIVLTGFVSGMVGISGGSFLVPLMVLACCVPMHRAVGTASTLIATIAFMGFAGHAVQGDFNPSVAVPLAAIAIIGGILGGKVALKTKPMNLKKLFAYTNWAAAFVMLIKALHTKGII
jgi:hypothetical protein